MGPMTVDSTNDALITSITHQSSIVHAPPLTFVAIALREHYLANTCFFLQPLHLPLLPFHVLTIKLPKPAQVNRGRRKLQMHSWELRELSVSRVSNGWKLHLIALAEGLQVLLVLLYSLIDGLYVLLGTDSPLYFIIHAHRLYITCIPSLLWTPRTL